MTQLQLHGILRQGRVVALPATQSSNATRDEGFLGRGQEARAHRRYGDMPSDHRSKTGTAISPRRSANQDNTESITIFRS
jgi:hypothetical protein